MKQGLLSMKFRSAIVFVLLGSLLELSSPPDGLAIR